MHRRSLLLGAAASALAAPSITRASAPAGLVYVLDSRDATVSVIDAARGEVVRRTPALREPHHLVYSPDRAEIVVGDSAGNEFLFLEPDTGAIRRTLRVSNPYHLMYSPNAQWLTVASLRRNQIDLYRADDLTLVHRLAMPRLPSHIAWSALPPMPTPTIVGGQGLEPALSIVLTMKSITPLRPAEGVSMASALIFSQPPPLGMMVILSWSPGTMSV